MRQSIYRIYFVNKHGVEVFADITTFASLSATEIAARAKVGDRFRSIKFMQYA